MQLSEVRSCLSFMPFPLGWHLAKPPFDVDNETGKMQNISISTRTLPLAMSEDRFFYIFTD